MQRFLCLVFTLLAFGVSMADKQVQVSKANGRFALDMYKILSKTPGNVFFSPISAHAALLMCFQGADGTTYDKFATTLHVSDKTIAAEGYSSIIDTLNNIEDVTLHIANRLYLKTGKHLQEEFNSIIAKKFESAVDSVDFSNSKLAASAINEWVKEKTREKIQQLFEDDAFDDDTLLVLVNAIYFKGNWNNQFDKDQTRTEQFYVDENTTIDCQMMHKKGNFRLLADDNLGAQVLELPYVNENVSMFIVLPYEKNDIAEVEGKLTDLDFGKVLSEHKTEVIVALPKFKFETTIELEDTLTEMGLGEIFDSKKCNLSRMIANDSHLCVSRVIQKAFIEVNEEGAEAAAATGIKITPRCLRIFPEVTCNRPFIFFITTTSTDHRSIVFMGKVTRPTTEKYKHDEF